MFSLKNERLGHEDRAPMRAPVMEAGVAAYEEGIQAEPITKTSRLDLQPKPLIQPHGWIPIQDLQ